MPASSCRPVLAGRCETFGHLHAVTTHSTAPFAWLVLARVSDVVKWLEAGVADFVRANSVRDS
jgi:hypothetical protein